MKRKFKPICGAAIALPNPFVVIVVVIVKKIFK
jgi:hypothetical protein